MNPYLPDNLQDTGNDAGEDEVFDLACARFGTPDPTDEELRIANQELYDAWQDYEGEV
jgi:hypothetical protein